MGSPRLVTYLPRKARSSQQGLVFAISYTPPIAVLENRAAHPRAALGRPVLPLLLFFLFSCFFFSSLFSFFALFSFSFNLCVFFPVLLFSVFVFKKV
jgi:hypothetical protein